MKDILFLLALTMGWNTLQAQLPATHWKGQLTQTGGQDTFAYALQLTVNGKEVSGKANSENPLGGKARFAVKGSWDGQKMLLQEWKQEMPEKGQWCLKYLRLDLKANEFGQSILTGDWRADGCRPGTVWLFPAYEDGHPEEASISKMGRWTGHLDQLDREYGFYYQVELSTDGQGTSGIVSEGSGGTAKHELIWEWDSTRQLLTITEQRVLEKTDPDWPWCIKQAELKLETFADKQILSGNWTGIIEGYTLKNGGSCASGKMYLEKPIVRKATQQKVENQAVVYEKTHGRQLRVDRVLKVSSPKLKVRIWDNGTVDGDIVTIFLNGKQLVKNLRARKHKWSIPVTLTEEENLLIIHADDLGDITPNTVAVSIDDGTKEEVLVISSDLRVSGGILIQPFEYGGLDKN